MLKVIVSLFLCFTVVAEDLYIAQVASGSGDGSSCANAKAITFFNSGSNWGAGVGKISAGDTVHLCGTLTNTLAVQGDGSLGSPITIIYESGANSSAPLWGPLVTQAAIYIGGHSNIVVDSAVRQLNIQCTDNGTVLGQQNDSFGVYMTLGANNCSVINLTITNMYKNAGHADITGFGQSVGAESVNNLTISNNWLSDGATVVGYAYSGAACSNLSILNNKILVGNHLLTLGTEIGFLHDVIVQGNTFDRLDEWDVFNSGRHLDAIIAYNNSTNTLCTLSNVTFAGNTFGPNVGTNNTAGIFLNGFHTEHMKNIKIYNNLFLLASTESWRNGCLALQGTNGLVANNTFISADFGTGIAIAVGGTIAGTFPGGPFFSAGYNCVNNLMYQMGCCISEGSLTAACDVSPWFSNTNIYSALAAGTGTFVITNNGATTFPGWKFFYPSLDQNSTTNLSSFDATYAPLPGSSALNFGVNLTSLGITNDFYGNARPAAGSWTAGAVQSTGTPPPATSGGVYAQGRPIISGRAIIR